MVTPEKTAAGGAEEGTVPAISVVDSDGTMVGWSRAAEELFGYTAEEILGRPGADLRGEPGDASSIWSWEGGAGDDDFRTGLVELRHHDGHPILAHLQTTRISTPGGKSGWVVSALPLGPGGSGSAVLEPLLIHAPMVVAVWDSELRSVWLNEGAQRLREVFPYFEIGRSLPQSGPVAQAPVPTDLIRRVLADGNPVIDRETRCSLAGEAEERALSSFLFRVEGLDRRPIAVCLLAIDITHSRARDRLAMLREASIRIGTTLDVRKTAQELVDLAVPGFADYATVDLTEAILPGSEPLGRTELPAPSATGIPVFRRAALASIHGQVPGALWPTGQPVFVPPDSPFTHVLETERSYLEPVLNTAPGGWLDNDPHRARVIRETGMHTLVIVPLKARGAILGIAMFLRTDNKTPFTTDDQLLAEELSARAALSLDNARQYTREHDAALALQRHLLPRNLSGGDAMDVASRYVPSDRYGGVGGDWFDAIALPDSRVALVVGDVTGHGINAAATMGRLRTVVRTLASMGLPPHEVLDHLDNLFTREADEDYGPGETPLAATVLYALYDPANRRCTLASAGHLPPAVVHPAGTVDFLELPVGTPIGLGLGVHRSLELDLAGGSLMVLYTDGLIERRESDIDAGMRRLGEALTLRAGPLQQLCGDVIDDLVSETVEDDVTLLLARTRMAQG